jgi:hypothetical protein
MKPTLVLVLLATAVLAIPTGTTTPAPKQSFGTQISDFFTNLFPTKDAPPSTEQKKVESKETKSKDAKLVDDYKKLKKQQDLDIDEMQRKANDIFAAGQEFRDRSKGTYKPPKTEIKREETKQTTPTSKLVEERGNKLNKIAKDSEDMANNANEFAVLARKLREKQQAGL